MKTKKPNLAFELTKQHAQDISALSAAHREAAKLTNEKYMASGLIIEIRDLSGKTVLGPVMIADGLNTDTVRALRADIANTYNARLALNHLK